MERVAPRTLDTSELGDALDVLAGAERLTIFAGAGLSAEAGLPTWTELIRRMLERVAPQTPSFRAAGESDEQNTREFADLAIARLGLFGAASAAKAHFGERFGECVADALYGDARVPLKPGPTARSIARLVCESGREERPLLVTTNFDRLLEIALSEHFVATGREPDGVRAATSPETMGGGGFPVAHVHGLIDERPDRRGQPQLVLAEDDFLAILEDRQGWREVLRERLEATTCLFVGMSLTDPNVLGYLYRAQPAAETPRRLAVSVAQTTGVAGRTPPPDFVLGALQDAGKRRLERVGVEVVLLPDYGSASQFVDELQLHSAARARSQRDAYATAPWSFARRLQAAEEQALRAGVLPAREEPERFEKRQPLLRERLATGTAAIALTFSQIGPLDAPGERLALHLWIAADRSRALVLAAQSNQLSFDAGALDAAPIQLPTSFLVTEAFCNGTVVEASGAALASSRWGSMLAVPFAAEEVPEPPGAAVRLPSGVIVLASNEDGPAGLDRLADSPADKTYLIAALTQLGSAIVADALQGESSGPSRALTPWLPRGGDLRVQSDHPPQLGPGTRIGGAPPEGVHLRAPWTRVADAGYH